MTVKAIRIKNRINLTPEKDREVKAMIIMLAVFAATMIIGAGSAVFTAEKSDLNNIIVYWLTMRTEWNIAQMFINSLVLSLSLLFVIFVSGFSCIGIPVAVSVPILKGIGTGYIAGYLFSYYSAKGIGYYLLSILPSNIISVACLLTACNYSVFLSNDIAACLSGKKTTNDNFIRSYIYKFFILFIFTSFSALADAILAKTFCYFFGAV